MYHRKCKELLRLINLKQSALNETVKIIISIDCAANSCGNEFDHDQAIKLSGLKKKEYNRQKELFEKLLDLTKELSLPEICAQLELNDAIKICANRLLTEYKKRNTLLNDVNMQQQMLASMAIFQSCKLKKFKGSNIKAKLMHLSKLNSHSWKQLENEWNEWIEKYPPQTDQLKVNRNCAETEEEGENLPKI